MSKTYLDWAKRNFKLNDLSVGANHFFQANCLEWLKQNHTERYDLIFVDPPTFSNSKKMEGYFDVQRDHVKLLHDVGRLLSDDGEIIFQQISDDLRWIVRDFQNGILKI